MVRHWLAAALCCVACASAQAGVTRILLDRIESPVFDGREFGAAGRYEKIVGRAWGEIDPADPLNANIVYVNEAPRNERGRVGYSIDFAILMPIDPAKGNGTLLYDVVNRGGRRAFDVFHLGASAGNNPSMASDAGDGFLLQRGYTLVVSGWEADLLPNGDDFTAEFPVATRKGGSPIIRTITAEFIVTAPTYTLPLGWDNGRVLRPHPAVQRKMSTAKLIRRAHADAPDELIPADEWSFGRCADGKTVTPSDVDVCLPAGFSPDAVYYLAYEAREPLVMGLAFAATRDLVSFLRNDTTQANPMVGRAGREPRPHTIRHAIGFGRADGGRFLKDFVYQGFNQDEAKRMVFDGVIALTSGARLSNVNTEFAMPGRFSTALVDHYAQGDQFPFSYETIRDPRSGRSDGILARCRAQNSCPKIMHWDSATEMWGGRGSLVATDPLGKTSVPIPENVRLYYFAGTQHAPVTQAGATEICQNLSNPNSYREAARALLVAMQDWVANGRPPPPSRYPSVGDGTLVRPLPQQTFGFPEIAGIRYTGEANHLFVNDYNVQPPQHTRGSEYAVLVPKVDRDGNELAGVRSVTLQVPLGTYAGWNLRRKGYMQDRSCFLDGSFIPFARYRVDRGKDPRPSLEERYVTKGNYVRQVEAAAQRLQRERFLLPDDAERVIREARERDIGF